MLLSLPASAATRYVAGNAAAGGDGSTTAKAFKAIGDCVKAAKPGDVCSIASGTYREDLRVTQAGTAAAPLTLRAEKPGSVVVSALDALTPGAGGVGKWEAVSINGVALERLILPAGFDQGTGKNLLFLNGEPLVEARWPNVKQLGGQTRADYAITTGGGRGASIDAEKDEGWFEHPATPAWAAGANIVLLSGSEWFAEKTVVRSTSPGSLRFAVQKPDFATPARNDSYFLFGKLEALDANNEWFFDADGVYGPKSALYRLPSKEATQTLEWKRRYSTLTLAKGASYLTVEGLSFKGGAITAEQGSSGLVLDGITGDWLSHSMVGAGAGPGIYLHGSKHALKHSLVAHVGAAGVVLNGATDCTLEDNVVHDTGYIPDGVGIEAWGGASGNTIRKNTVFDSSTHGIGLCSKASEYAENQVFRAGRISIDLGSFNGYDCGNAKGTRVHHNLAHDGSTQFDTDYKHWGINGFRIDTGGSKTGGSNFVFDHNVAFRHTASAYSMFGLQPGMENYPDSALTLVHNTGVGNFGILHDGYEVSGVTLVDNLLDGECSGCSEAVAKQARIEKNLFSLSELTGNLKAPPGFVDGPAYDLRLAAGSPAIDSGIDMPPWTGTTLGKGPDLGAFEANADPLMWGAQLRAGDLAALTVSCSARATGSVCRISNLPQGRSMTPDFALTLGGAAGGGCKQGLAVRTAESFIDCSFATLPSGAVEVSLAGETPVKTSKPAVTDKTPLGCSQNAYTIPVQVSGAGALDMDSRAVPFFIDTAALIAAKKLAPDCSNLRVRSADLSRDFAYFLDPDSCNSKSTLLFVKRSFEETLGGIAPPDGALFRVQTGDASWKSQSELAGLFPVMAKSKLLWLNADSLKLASGEAVMDWKDSTSKDSQRHAAAAAKGSAPTFVPGTADATARLRFDGVNDRLEVRQGATPGLGDTGRGAFYAVAWNKTRGTSTYPRVLSASSAGGNDYTAPGYGLWADYDDVEHLAIPHPDGKVFADFLQNGKTVTLSRVTLGGASQDAGGSFAADVGEVLIFEEPLTWYEHQQVISYLSARHHLSPGAPKATALASSAVAPCAGVTAGADTNPVATPPKPGSAGVGSKPTDATPGSLAGGADESSGGGCGCRVAGDAPKPSRGLAWLTLLAALGLTRANKRVSLTQASKRK